MAKRPGTEARRVKSIRELADAGLFDEGSSFLIDARMKGFAEGKPLPLHSRWQTTEHLTVFGRRMLEVAAGQAFYATEKIALTGIIEDWRGSAKNAERALRAVEALLKDMTGGSIKTDWSREEFLLPSLNQMAAHTLQPPLGDEQNPEWGRELLSDRMAWAQKKAGCLIEARSLLDEMQRYFAGRARTLATGRSNPGDPVKSAAVKTFAEAWLFLTGRIPGSGTVRNPFLEFASDAWVDLGGSQDDSLEQPLRATVKQMRSLSKGNFRPSWQS